jgi:methyl-accepting chemotaxis protein
MFDHTVTGPDQNDLPSLRSASARVIVGIIWAHGPALLLIQAWTSHWSTTGLSLWAGLASTATFMQRSAPAAARTRLTIAAAACAMPALVVLVLDGQSWQVDAHMHFFAMLAVVASLLDWRAVIVGAAVIAMHHTVLNLILPALVFPGGGDLARVAAHAVILVFEAASLAWLANRAAAVMTAAAAAANEITALTKAREAMEQQTRLTAALTQRAVMNKTADVFETKVGHLASVLSAGASALQATAQSMSSNASQTNRQASLVMAAAGEASAGVQTVAAAAEELTASIGEISRRMAHSSSIADRAVMDARRTDATVQALRRCREDRACRAADLGDRGPDKPAGVERHHRGGPGR